MKKTHLHTIALAISAIVITQSCSSPSSKSDKFMGEWKRTDKVEKDNSIIKRQDDAIIGVQGKDTIVGLYDKNRDVLKFYVWGQSGVLSYNEKNDHLLINNGKDGEFKRVK